MADIGSFDGYFDGKIPEIGMHGYPIYVTV
jgi:hypothetical protein